MINFNNNNITGMSYNGHKIIKAYGCDGNLVWEIEPQYRWKDTYNTMCSGSTRCYVAVKQVSTDGGKTWKDVTPTETTAGTVIYEYSYDCGYEGTPKLKIYDNYGNVSQLNYESSPNNVLTNEEFWYVRDKITGSCDGLHYEVGDGVTILGDEVVGRIIAFSPCTESIDFGKNVTRIKDGVTAAECSGLTGVTLPPNITKLGVGFTNDVSLRTMTIPSKVTEIYNPGWSGCTGLESLVFLPTTPPTLLGDKIFESTNNCILYVPASSVNSYKSAWPSYASRIQPAP